MTQIADVRIKVKLQMPSHQEAQKEARDTGGRVAGSFNEGFKDSLRNLPSVAQSQVKGLNASIVGLAAGIGASLGTAITSAVGSGLGAISSLSGKVMEAGTAAERSKAQFTALLGSADAATSTLSKLRDFAATTPFELPEVENAARNLITFGVEANKLSPMLKAIGNAAAATGAPFDELAEVVGKAKTQGQLFSEDINQLTGRGIPIIQELAKQFGVAESEVKKLASEGKVGFDDLEKALMSMSDEGGRFNGQMEKLAATTSGKMSNLSDSLTKSFVAIFEAVKPAIDAVMSAASTFLNSMNVDLGEAGNLAQSLADFIKSNEGSIKNLAVATSAMVSGAFTAWRDSCDAIWGYFERYPAVLGLIRGVASEIGKGFKIWWDLIKSLWDTLKFIAELFGNVVQTVSNIATEMGKASSFSDKIKAAWEGTVDLIKSGFDLVKEWLGLDDGGTGGGTGGDPHALGALGGFGLPQSGGTASPYTGDLNSTAIGRGGRFGAPRTGRIHAGQDYALPHGTPVNASHSGVVTRIDTDEGEYQVILRQGNTETRYTHLSAINVSRGSRVTAGQVIGRVGGSRGSWGSSGTHLHYEIWIDGVPKDPLQFPNGIPPAPQGDGAPDVANALPPIPISNSLSAPAPYFDSSATLTPVYSGYSAPSGNFTTTTVSNLKLDVAQIEAGSAASKKAFDEWLERERQARQIMESRRAYQRSEFDKWMGEMQHRNQVNQMFKTAFEEQARAEQEAADAIAESVQRNIELWDEHNQQLAKNFWEANQLQVAVVEGVGGAFKSAITEAITGTKSLGAVALDLLGNIASRLLDLGLNSIFGSVGGGGILGSLFGGLFGGPTQASLPVFNPANLLGNLGGFTGAIANIPSFSTGGVMPYTGLAHLHKGEVILNESQQKAIASNSVTVNVNYSGSANGQDAHRLAETVANIVDSRIIHHTRPRGLLAR